MIFPVWLPNRLISAGSEPVIFQTKKYCIALNYIQFSTKSVYNTMRKITMIFLSLLNCVLIKDVQDTITSFRGCGFLNMINMTNSGITIIQIMNFSCLNEDCKNIILLRMEQHKNSTFFKIKQGNSICPDTRWKQKISSCWSFHKFLEWNQGCSGAYIDI